MEEIPGLLIRSGVKKQRRPASKFMNILHDLPCQAIGDDRRGAFGIYPDDGLRIGGAEMDPTTLEIDF